jgi:hypothetical protein
MQVFIIKTTQWQEDDFYIMTSLNESQIRKIIQPIVNFERENDLAGNPYDYLSALSSAYSKSTIISEDNFETIQL